jgi:hypothetical protein
MNDVDRTTQRYQGTTTTTTTTTTPDEGVVEIVDKRNDQPR